MRVVVTQIESDGTMWRRMVETAGRGDAGLWQELITRALAVPLPYRPAPGGPIYGSAPGHYVSAARRVESVADGAAGVAARGK
jgi:hypothetical protein